MIFLCLHRYFCAELRPAGSWAADHMPFTPETSFPSGPAYNYSHLLISWILAPQYNFYICFLTGLVTLPFQASCTLTLHTLLGSVHFFGFGDIYPHLLTYYRSSFCTDTMTKQTCPSPLNHSPTKGSNDYFVIPQSMYSPWIRWVFLSGV